MTDCPSSSARTCVLGWALFGVFLLLFAGTVGVALLYLPDYAVAARIRGDQRAKSLG